MDKNLTRRELQPMVDGAVLEALREAEVTIDEDHKRRLIRVLLHTAARMAQSSGHHHESFAALAKQVFHEELPRTHLEALAKLCFYSPKVGIA